MEPTPNDIAMVAAAMGGQPQQPAPQPTQQPQPVQPAQQQPVQPTPQPTPSQQPVQNNDPFTSFFQQPTEPVAPTQPAPTQPVQPTEPVPTPQPQQPVAPQQPQAPQVQTYDQYIESVLRGTPQAPNMPDPSKVDPNSEEAIGQFFKDLMTTAEQRFEANYARKQAIQNSERGLWEEAFSKYGSLRSNNQLRDMVHAIRMGEFKKGFAITPTQAADRLLDAMRGSYQRGVADNQVVTTIQQVQPNGGGTQPVPTTLDTDKALLAVQTGGEAALAQILDSQIKNGQM